MNFWKRATALVACLVALGAHGGNVAGLWWNESENGWGINLSQQGDTVFATMFAYGTNNRPTWFVAPNLAQVSTEAFSGLLYETSGPWWGTTFNPAAVGVRQVGTMTFRSPIGDTGTLAYSVDGTSVSKSLTRQTWKGISLAGDYRISPINRPYSSGECSGITLSNLDDMRVRDTGLITIYGDSGSPVCEISGTFYQYGQYKYLDGSIACGASQGNFAGTILVDEIRGEGIVGETTSTKFLSGLMLIRGPGSCRKSYQFTGTKYTAD